MGLLIRAKKARLVVLVLFCYCLLVAPVSAEEKPLQLYEQKIKAGLVYNLLKSTAWPPTSSVNERQELKVCLFGEDPFDGYLSPLAGRTAQQSLIFITQVKKIKDMETCSVVIIHRSEEKHLSELLRFLEQKNVLTISDIAQFAQRGGMVEMAKEDNKISLYVNKHAVDYAGLAIHKQMLRLAKIVSG